MSPKAIAAAVVAALYRGPERRSPESTQDVILDIRNERRSSVYRNLKKSPIDAVNSVV